MWKVILLFSLVVLAFGSDLRERFSLKVKVVGRIVEEKPKVVPPDRIELKSEDSYLDLSSRLLEPPRELEEATLNVPKEGKGCGEPKDRAYYRSAVGYYLKGKLRRAESRLLDLLSIQNSSFIPQAKYILGLVYFRTGREEEALELFRSSCSWVHPYRDPACESVYALTLMMGGSINVRTGYDLWDRVASLKSGKEVPPPDCTGTVFVRYCSYVEDFIRGKVNEDYRESTEIRRAIVLIKRGDLAEAERILKKHTYPGSRYRAEALYYMGVVSVKRGDQRKAYRYASVLETLDPELARNLYRLTAQGEVVLSRVAYRITGMRDLLERAGALSYNSGNYALAYREFSEAGRPLLAAWSAIRMGDYELAYRVLKGSAIRSKEHYLWLLEVLYWTGREREMELVLKEIENRFPDLYREYIGWLLFKKERWEEAARFFKDPYHKALAFYNAGRYEKVLEVLKRTEGFKERILKAKAAVSLGKGDLARRFLKGETPEEIYLIGMSYFIEEDYLRAINYFDRVKGPDRIGRRAFLRIGDSLYNLGRYDQAKEVYREILRRFPDSKEATDATLALAQIELQSPSDDLKVLIKEFERKFPDSPLIPDLRYQLANLYLKEGKVTRAKSILEDLVEVDPLRYKAMLKLAELEEDPERKEEMLKRVIKEGGREEKERAAKLLTDLYYEREEFEKLADFLAEGGYAERKKALTLYMEHNLEKAVNLFDRLLSENPEDQDLALLALKMYEKTRGKKYLQIAAESDDPRVRAEALYRLGLIEKRKDRRKALERFVEVVLMPERVHPYYNRSIIEAADILVKMKARRDASCLLDKIDREHLSEEELKRVRRLKSKLPECEVKR